MGTETLARSAPAILVGGDRFGDAESRLVEFSVEEHIAGLTSCRLRLEAAQLTSDGWDTLALLDRRRFDFGARLEVKVGDETLFAGTISALALDLCEHRMAEVVVDAEDALWAFRTTRRTRSWEDVSAADVAEQLASDHGLTPEVDLDGPTRAVVTQVNLSDLAFLRQLAYADGAELWVADRTLHVQRRGDRDNGRVTLTYGSTLSDLSIRADLAHQVSDVTVSGWSVADKEAIAEVGDSAALSSELSGLKGGGDLLADARHERVTVEAPLAADDARARAAALYLDRARRFVVGRGVTSGTPDLHVGGRVTLAGVGDLFNGEHRCVWTRHHFDLERGFRTDFEVERAGIGGAS